MPLIDVTYDSSVSADALHRLGDILPAIVSEAVDCPDDPWTGPPGDGDIEIRFRAKSPFDVGSLNCVVEVQAKLFQSRERDKRRRVELIRDRVAASGIEVGKLGVWLILAEGEWTQHGDGVR